MKTYFITYKYNKSTIIAKVKAFCVLHAIFKFKRQRSHMKTRITKIEREVK